ncbi:hypothetical protein [Haloferula sp.]|uniref:hypothetical protein n=1 Tax=Haloferula sp. TaxID=2497595 RepID=UPI003C7786E7
MKTKTVEFASPSELAEMNSAPWGNEKQSRYQDLVLKAEFAQRRFKFPVGTTWFRIVPALRGSRGSMMKLHALNYKGGRHVHPKTLTPGTKSTFDAAYEWCKTNRPESLFCKSKPDGYRLLTDPLFLFWIVFEEDSKIVARLVLESGYDGSRGGTPGLGHQVMSLTQERDENGNLVTDPIDQDLGRQIGVERTQPAGTRFPSYALRMGRTPVPMPKYIDRMDPSEIEALVPIEDVVHSVSVDEEWGLLENVIEPEIVKMIREAQSAESQ